MQKIDHNKRRKNARSAAVVSLLAIMIAVIALIPVVTAKGEPAYGHAQESEPDSSSLPDDKDAVSQPASEVIYVQHDGSGRDIYLLASQGETTTV